MNELRDIRFDLDPALPPDEADALAGLAEELRAHRPVPSPAFRGAMRRRLAMGGRPTPRPRRLRLLIAAYAGTGSVLLAVAAIGVAGTGPLSP